MLHNFVKSAQYFGLIIIVARQVIFETNVERKIRSKGKKFTS